MRDLSYQIRKAQNYRYIQTYLYSIWLAKHFTIRNMTLSSEGYKL